MQFDFQPRPTSPAVRVARCGVLLAALFALSVGGATAGTSTSATKTPRLDGRWGGTYSGALSGKFTLNWRQTLTRQGSLLRGAITLSNPRGTYSITGSTRGSKIKFGAVAVGATYAGSVTGLGLKMSGTWKSAQQGGSWSAHKVLKLPTTKAAPAPG